MKIAGSSISMESEHRLSEYNSSEFLVLNAQASEGAVEKISAYAKKGESTMVSAMKTYSHEEELSAEQRRKENQQNSIRRMLEHINENKNNPNFEIKTDEDMQITLLRKLLAALNGKGRLEPYELEQAKRQGALDLRSSSIKKASMVMEIRGIEAGAEISADAPLKVGTTVGGTVWQKITAVSGEHYESEFTSFKSTGMAVTSDGRSISFGMELTMARNFTERFESLTAENYIVTDPLIINIDNSYAGLTDVKFKFDLDSDGREDEISFAAEGSGFLALDRNGNGTIDDGSELFGTASGDGFADLAEFDDDRNGWIDENDQVYSKLRVWVKDSEGNDRLLDLKEANVGAIYLGSASTEFSIKDDSNAMQGAVRKTGIYLKETGEVGTIQHVDLAM